MPDALRRLTLRDLEVCTVDTGGAGRPLVMLHGLTGHRDDFHWRMPELAALGRTIAPDLRGHGDASETRDLARFAFGELVEDLEALVAALGLERFDLLGHSFGGMVALRYTLAHPESVASLVCMNTAPFGPADFGPEAFEKAGSIAEARGMAFLQERVEAAARRNPNPSPSDRMTERWADLYWPHQRRRYRAMQPAAYRALGVAMVEQTPLVPRLGEIGCPTSVIVGDQDVEFLAGADALVEGIPGARHTLIPEAGHHPHMENPDAWMQAIRAHLAWVRGEADV